MLSLWVCLSLGKSHEVVLHLPVGATYTCNFSGFENRILVEAGKTIPVNVSYRKKK